MTLEQRIAARVRQHRQAAGLTQSELANKIGAHTQQIYRYETGGGRIPATHLCEIARVLALPLEAFFDEQTDIGTDDELLLRDTRTVSLVDVVPTILSLLDIASPTELHGIPLFGDPTLDARDEVFSHCARGTSVTVDGRWKLHLPEDRIAERGGMTALFDLKSDPGENSPVDDPAMTRELTARIRAWKQRYGEVGDKMSIDEQRKLLLQMGYVGLANELDEDTTQEEIRNLMKEGRRKKARAEAKLLNEAAKREGAAAGD